MLAYMLKRLGVAVLVALTVSFLAYMLVFLSGDPALALAGEGARQADIEMVRHTYGFDRPIVVQYVDWLGKLVQGNLGMSVYFKTEVAPLVFDKLQTTLMLGVAALAVALLISVPLGVLAAIYKNSWIDRLCLAVAVLGQALPNFFFALLLIMLFSISWHLLPVSGSGTWQHLVMPALALGYYAAPAFMRLIRAGMIEVLGADYIRTARAKGLPPSHGDLQARAAQRHRAGGGAGGRATGIPAGRLGGDRDHLRARWPGLPGLPEHHLQGLSGDAGDRAAAVGDLHPADAGLGHRQRLARSAHPGRVTTMSAQFPVTIAATAAIAAPVPPSAMRQLLKNKALVIGGVILLVIVVLAVFAPLFAPYDPYVQDLANRTVPPFWYGQGGWLHPLGTDQLGRDYLSRLIYGGRISLLIGLSVAVISGLIGTTMGMLAGYFGGKTDMAVSFLVTTRLSMPVILVALATVALVGGSLWVVIAVLGLLKWDRFAVVMRSATQQVRSLEYVAAAQAAGASTTRIVLTEVLPNVLPHLIVIATLEAASAILLEASLSFLGLGVQPPLPSWGLMISEAKAYMFFSFWLIAIPGTALALLIFAINLAGDGLHQVFMPDERS